MITSAVIVPILAIAGPADAGAGTFPMHGVRSLPGGHGLTVSPGYEGGTLLEVGTLEWTDALPTYRLTLSEVRSGHTIPMRRGWADSFGDEDLEGPYSAESRFPLRRSVQYQASFTVSTTGFWHCSIYDPDGCSWVPGSRTHDTWRFTYNGATIKGKRYLPKTRIQLSRKTHWREKGWKVTATLKWDGKAFGNRRIYGQWRTNAGWHPDNSWKTDKRGRVAINFYGESKRTTYRFVFKGEGGEARRSTSKPIVITARSGRLSSRDRPVDGPLTVS